jgi:hypothetical protein
LRKAEPEEAADRDDGSWMADIERKKRKKK